MSFHRPIRTKLCGALLVLVCLLGLGCEKDDICVDGDTPLLVIRFKDATDRETLKAVTTLRLIGQGQESPLSDPFPDRSTRDSIALPLRINSPETVFSFISESASDSEGNETGNIDEITFSYQTEEIFVSRACGRIANFTGLQAILTSDALPWIQDIEIVNPKIEDQNSAQIVIYH